MDGSRVPATCAGRSGCREGGTRYSGDQAGSYADARSPITASYPFHWLTFLSLSWTLPESHTASLDPP